MSNQNVGSQAGAQETNGKATWSLVLGILSLTLCGLIAGILAIVLGKQAQREIAGSGGLQRGEGRAKWGIILGWISVVISVIAGIIALVSYLGN
jgi:hypothetical protein